MLHVCFNGRDAMMTCARRSSAMAVGALLLSFVGCDDSKRPATPLPGGSLIISAFADADVLMPPLTMTGQGLQVVDAVFDRLAQPTLSSDGLTAFAPALATSWTWSADSLSITFAVDERARWHDGQPVTARDVRFTWMAYVDSALGSPTAQSLRNIDSVQVRDTHTATVWFARRTASQLSDAVTQMRILPAHLLDSIPRAEWRTSGFARRPVGSGRFRFAGWQAGSRLEVVADSANYRGRPGLDRVIWTVAPDPAAATMRLLTGDADFLESVRPDAVAEFEKHADVALVRSPSLVYGFLQFNMLTAGTTPKRHALFTDRSLRRALSMAIDRELVVRAAFDTAARVALGPFTRVQLGADTLLPIIAFDTARASQLLDSIGWRVASPGAVRTRAGRPLRFSTLVPSSSTQRLRIAVHLQQLFRAVGIQMDVEKVEFNTMNARLAKGDFDAAVMALSADPDLSGIRGVWSTAAGRTQGGSNFGSYASARFDTLLDSAEAQPRAADAHRVFREAYAEILGDAPAIWLYEPWNLSAVRRDVRPVGLRPDGWWMQLGDWRRDASR
ncbi:MAG: peptide ABC transporter substrate-binding protein [Gemmatimonas sp.]